MVLPSERFSLAFQLDRVVKGMRLRILAFGFLFNPTRKLKSKKRLQTETNSDGLLVPDIWAQLKGKGVPAGWMIIIH